MKKNHFYRGGAYTGDTTKKLCKIFFDREGLKNLRCLCFEPDRFNHSICKTNLEALENKYKGFKSVLFCSGLWDKSSIVSFEEGAETASKVTETNSDGRNTVEIPVTSVDDIVHELGLQRVTFIKMDIEGSEPNALVGGYLTIQRDHPRLSICIYHTDEQVISIIEWIHDNFPFYSIYVRHYHWSWTECVLYAIER